MNLGELIKSVMDLSDKTHTTRPVYNKSNFIISPDSADDDFMYADLVDVDSIKTGFYLISRESIHFSVLEQALIQHKIDSGLEFDESDDFSKEVLCSKFGFKVSNKYEGIGYIFIE